MADFQLNVKINGVEQSVKTIGQLEKALAETNAELAMVEQGSKEFKFLQNQASNLDKVIVELNKDTADFNKNIKNVTQSSEQLNKSFTTTTQAASSGINQATTSSQSLRSELRQITQELQNLEPGSARFVELSTRAGQLRDTIGDTNAVIQATAGNLTERFGRALSSTAQIGIAGFQGITAAQALFGSENEDLNETLVKLSALLNLSQAVETFGGLGDKITEITAGFGLFTSGSAATTTALAEQTVVTNTATTATGGLNLAMRALPIVAIVAAVAALATGLYSYINATNETKKAEEKRKKEQEAIIKGQKEQAEFVAKESSELVQLLFQLKQTNAASTERRKILKTINSEYGGTLKNLKDEVLFQEQVNGAIKSYITVQQLRFKLKKNDDAFNASLERQSLATQELNGYLATQTKLFKSFGNIKQVNTIEELDALGKKITDSGEDWKKYGVTIGVIRSKIDDVNRETETQTNLTERRVVLIKEETKVQDQYFKNLDDGNKIVKENNQLEKDATALALFKTEILKENNSLILNEQTQSVKKTQSVIDDLELERKTALTNLEDRKNSAIKTDTEEVKNKKKSKSEKEAIEKAYTDAVIQLNDRYNKRIAIQTNQELSDRQALYDELLLQNNILQEEILFGDQNTADQKGELQQRILQLSLNEIEQRIKNEKLGVDEFELLLKEKLRLQGEYSVIQLGIDTKVANANRQRDLINFIKLQSQLLNVKILENKRLEGEDDNSFKKRLEIEGEYLFQREDGQKLTRDKLSREERQSYDNIIKQKENLDNRYNLKKLENDVEYNNKRKNDSKLTDEEIFANRLNLANQLIQIFQNFADAASEIEAARVQAEDQKLTEKNEEFIKSQQSRVDALEAGYQRELAAGNLTEEQRLKRRKQTDDAIAKITTDTNNVIDASNEELAKKQFKRQKALNITNAIISGAQAVMSAIAQFGPPPSPLGIAGIAAAGIITVAQIAAISKQQYNGGSTGVTGITTPSPPDTSTAIPSVSQSPISSTGGFTSFSSGVGQATGASTTPMTGSMTSNSQRVYVVESDITEVQRRVRVTEEGSSFG